jgi:ABC-type multidrug transport system fused ATPase/permease subunit
MTTTIDPTAVLGRAFGIYREHAASLLPAAAAVFLINAIVLYVFDSGVLAIVASLVTMIIHTFYQGMVVRLVDDVRDGSLDSSVGDLFRGVAPVAVPLLAVSLIVGILVGIGFVLLLVPGLFLLTIWAVTAPVVVLEGKGPIDALGRSRELVRGNGWSVLGLMVLLFVLMFGVSFVAGVIGAVGGDLLRALLTFVATVAIAPLSALAVSVLYFQLRDGR